MGSLASILSGPIGDLLGKVTGVIDGFHTSGEEKLEAQRKLLEIERAFQTRVMELDAEWAKVQASVINTEAGSESWMARNWRPITMLTFVFIIAYNFIFSPIFRLVTLEIPPDMWDLLKIGMSGYIVGRTVEKTAPAVTEIVTTNSKKK